MLYTATTVFFPHLQDHLCLSVIQWCHRLSLVPLPALPAEQFLKPLPANKRQIRPTKFHDFTLTLSQWEHYKFIDRQATLNSRPFLLSSPFKHWTTLELFFVHITTDWNHLSDNQVKPEGPHTWGLKAMEHHPKHHLIYTHTLLSCLIYTLS